MLGHPLMFHSGSAPAGCVARISPDGRCLLSPAGHEGLIHEFDKPSNALFVPAELCSVNCYVCNVVIYAHTLKINGDAQANVVVDDFVLVLTSAERMDYNPSDIPWPVPFPTKVRLIQQSQMCPVKTVQPWTRIRRQELSGRCIRTAVSCRPKSIGSGALVTIVKTGPR
jgi:hypothetical protein